jgi:hypothetical protein
VPISVVKCSWVTCSEVLQCSDGLLVLFIVLYMVACFVYFCLILSVMYSYCYIYVFLLTCMLCSVYSLQTDNL